MSETNQSPPTLEALPQAPSTTGGKKSTSQQLQLHQILIGSFSSQGGCSYQEDRFYAQPFSESNPTTSLLCIFDGHAGFKASEYSRKHLPPNIFNRISSSSTEEEEEEEKQRQQIQKLLAEAFIETDAGFLRKLEDCGSTACVSLILKNIHNNSSLVFVANAGDSRCIIGSTLVSPEQKLNGGINAIEMSHDHKPSDPIERERIESSGHEVIDDFTLEEGKRIRVARIDGQIACSRGIGDGELKDYGVPPEKQAITCIPDINQRSLISGKDKFIVLACDGVWDVMSNFDVVKFINDKLQELNNQKVVINQEKVDEIARQLVVHATDDLGSRDNTTAVIGFFVWA